MRMRIQIGLQFIVPSPLVSSNPIECQEEARLKKSCTKGARVHILTLDAPCTLCTTDYRHMLAKSIILFGPNSNPSPK